MRHNSVALHIHLMWHTWDRLPLISHHVERRLLRAVEAKARDLGCVALAVNGTEDHVHLLVALPASLPVAELAKQVKGASLRFANEVLLPGQFKWQGHYGAFSVSRWDVERARGYVERQKEHHAEGSLIAELEEAWEESLPPSGDAEQPRGEAGV